ncbi:MAG: YihY/virulence factor BrkB family protein, partial [Actinobacteria bacterium]|nr:YihY/virulence factor BrkB family protein [Actinomycetota bacterium]
LRVKDEIKDDNVALMAGGVVFYAMLAIFPALIAAMTLWGLLADPATIQQQVASFTAGLPASAADIITEQVSEATSGTGGALGWGFAIGLVGALWTASSGMKGLMNATNSAYDEEETRGFLKLRGLALGLTFLGIVFMLFTLSLVAIVPAVLGTIGLGSVGETLVQWGRWPVLAVAVMAALSVLYRYAADRDEPKWRWTTPGAVIGTVIWLLASGAFALYVSVAGRSSYAETYGALAGVIILMLWLFLTAFSVLLGAEINAELEHQTRRDTTSGEPRPRGQRDAYVADHVPDREVEESRH